MKRKPHRGKVTILRGNGRENGRVNEVFMGTVGAFPTCEFQKQHKKTIYRLLRISLPKSQPAMAGAASPGHNER